MGVSLQFQTVMLTNFANQKPENNARLKSKPKIASFLWVEIGLTCTGLSHAAEMNSMAQFSTCPAIFPTRSQFFMLKLVHSFATAHS